MELDPEQLIVRLEQEYFQSPLAKGDPIPEVLKAHISTDFFNREIEAMATTENLRVVCQDPGDGSGDVIVELPQALLEKLGWALGDELVIEGDKERISLKLKP